MRPLERVGITEKVIGLGLLLLVAAIVATFLVQSADDELYTANVNVVASEQRERPREVLIAQQMLPDLEGSRWKPMGEADATSRDDLSAAFGQGAAEAEAFGVRWVYRRRYETIDQPRDVLTVLVCDVESPAQAFGFGHARSRRTGQEIKKLAVGHDGWLSEVELRAGFRQGRYYSELSVSPPLGDAEEVLSVAARAIASVQLDYGSTFWADVMLPPAGRVEETFRYVHWSAIGIDSLDAVFLVDLKGGVTAWVTDAGTPMGAERLVDRIQSFALRSVASESAYETTEARNVQPQTGIEREGPLTMVPWHEGVLAVFAAGRHVHGAYGVERAGVVAAAMTAYSMVSSPVGGVTAAISGLAPGELDGPFPELDLAGWQRPREVARFTPDNLYVKINGRAAAYLQFHVVSLTFATYFHETDGDRTVDVYWYDMGEAVNAFGIYGSEASPGAEPVPIGREGYRVGAAIFFRKGASYIQVLPSALGDGDAQAAEEIAELLAEGIEDTKEVDWALDVLPQEGLIEGSLSFEAENAFSLDLLSNVYTAEYDRDGGRITLFIHRADDQAAARGEI